MSVNIKKIIAINIGVPNRRTEYTFGPKGRLIKYATEYYKDFIETTKVFSWRTGNSKILWDDEGFAKSLDEFDFTSSSSSDNLDL